MLFDNQITVNKFIEIFKQFKVVLFDQQDLKYSIIDNDDIFMIVENYYIKGYGNEDLYFYRKDNCLINIKYNIFYLNGRTKDGSKYMKRIVVNPLSGSILSMYNNLKHPFNTLKEKIDFVQDAIDCDYITLEQGNKILNITNKNIELMKSYGIEIPKLINKKENL